MVWSDQSSFPFYVIDNNGNIILTIDQEGLHLVGPNGRIDATIDPSNYPTIQWSTIGYTDGSKIVFIPGATAGAYKLAIQGNQYFSTLPGNPIMKGNILIDEGRTWIYNNTVPGQVLTGGMLGVGDQDLFITCDDGLGFRRSVVALNNTVIDIYVNNSAGVLQTEMSMDANGIYINTPGKPNVVYNNSTGFWSVPARDWTTIPTFNGWGNVAGYSTPAMKFGIDGRIYLKGVIQGGIAADGTQIFNVPSNPTWSPGGGLQVKLRPTTEGGGAADGRIIVNGVGQGFIFGMAGTTQIGMDGLSYTTV